MITNSDAKNGPKSGGSFLIPSICPTHASAQSLWFISYPSKKPESVKSVNAVSSSLQIYKSHINSQVNVDSLTNLTISKLVVKQ